MKRIRLDALGWDAPMVLDDQPDPSAPTGAQVVVAVEACGVCHRDLIDRGGGVPFMELPITLGHEATGRVLAIGPDVTRWRVGDRVGTLHRDSCGTCDACRDGEDTLCQYGFHVLGIVEDGGYATHLTLPERALYAMPDSVPVGEAAILNCTYGTAFRGLRSGGCGPGRTVVITGASGGVGSAAIEVASRMGARVVAVIRDPARRDYVSELGATSVVVDDGSGFHKLDDTSNADMVLDCVGEPTLNASLRCLRLGGTVIFVGNITQERLSLNVGLVIVKALRIIGSSGASPRDMADLLELRSDQPFAMTLRELPLEDAEAAHQQLRQGGVPGRLVLSTGGRVP
jgi:D-arabinose 1-dehydrogenase-like Zn-dependent alcohol dehydrogenase